MERRDTAFLPGFEPPAPAARIVEPRTLEQIEQTVESVVSYLDVLRPEKKAGAPIDRVDIADCRYEIAVMLHAQGLPVPDEAWLDEFIIELAGWWFEFALAPDVPPPAISELYDQPPKPPRPPAFDGPEVGWDPWNDPD